MPHVRPTDERCPECARLTLRVSELCAAVDLLIHAADLAVLADGDAAVRLARAAVARTKTNETESR